ncbi:MAG: HAD-IA family hydrolase [Pseudolabrys sp.]|jgi:HAD superfamily hydrolase (TIGR01509 family)
MTLLIFDCDGVLVDSEVLAHAAMADLLSELGRPIPMSEALKIFSGKRLRDALAAAESWLGAPIPPDVAARAGERLLATFRRELQPVDGVRRAIEALPYSRCVASSSTPERLRVSLEVTGLAPLFGDSVFSADRVEYGKPAPDLFLFAAHAMSAEPGACIVVEDSVPGIAAARAAGMAAIGFIGASHGNGDIGERLGAAGADVVIDAMTELPATVERLVTVRG